MPFDFKCEICGKWEHHEFGEEIESIAMDFVNAKRNRLDFICRRCTYSIHYQIRKIVRYSGLEMAVKISVLNIAKDTLYYLARLERKNKMKENVNE